MTWARTRRATTFLIALYLSTPAYRPFYAQVSSERALGTPVVLTREQASTIMPATVFFRGQTATIQQRNSSGLRIAETKLVLAALVDTSGYSSAIQQTYQAYLLTEVPLMLGGQSLGPGAYGFGFVTGEKMIVMDIGGSEVLRASTTHDQRLARPNPLQILPDQAPGIYRLYLGRSYVTLSPGEK